MSKRFKIENGGVTVIEINWSDVRQTPDSLKSYSIVLGVIAAARMIAVMKLPKGGFKPGRCTP